MADGNVKSHNYFRREFVDFLQNEHDLISQFNNQDS